MATSPLKAGLVFVLPTGRSRLTAVRRVVAGLLLGLGAWSIVLLAARLGALDAAEMLSYDWRMRAKLALVVAAAQAIWG